MKNFFAMTLVTATALLFCSAAHAGCGDVSNFQAPFQMVSLSFSSSPRLQAAAGLEADARKARSIVGMWSFKFISQGNTSHNPSIPDGAQLDFGYSVWHADGTEITNSGSRPPATGNFCFGVWRQTGFATYELNHFALGYDATTGNLNGKSKIGETVTLSSDGNTLVGTFTIDVYDPNGNQVDHLQGQLQASRVTVDTPNP